MCSYIHSRSSFPDVIKGLRNSNLNSRELQATALGIIFPLPFPALNPYPNPPEVPPSKVRDDGPSSVSGSPPPEKQKKKKNQNTINNWNETRVNNIWQPLIGQKQSRVQTNDGQAGQITHTRRLAHASIINGFPIDMIATHAGAFENI